MKKEEKKIKRKKRKTIIALTIAIMLLIVQVAFMLQLVNEIQGNGRVVNYAGIVRGATQRLVKNELYGNPDDIEIERLNDILLGLQTGEGTQNLSVLQADNYQKQLNKLAEEWENVKEAIYMARTDEGSRDDLYQLSETYFVLADKTVSAAEEYSDGIAKRLSMIEISVIANIFLVLGILIYSITSEIRNNRKLNRIAYIDPQTGLPNKRSCDEKMNDVMLIDEGQNVCCLMFDLNNLKTTNDTFGHEIGDALICSFASLLRQNMPNDMFVGRLGGDEFIGIQRNADPDDIQRRIDIMMTEASDMDYVSDCSKLLISFSYGCAYSKDQNSECTIKTLMSIADKNMYQNKIKMKKAMAEKDNLK